MNVTKFEIHTELHIEGLLLAHEVYKKKINVTKFKIHIDLHKAYIGGS